MKRFCFLLIFQVIMMAESAYFQTADAGNAFYVNQQINAYNLAPHLSYIEDAEEIFTIEQICKPHKNIHWQKITNDSVNFGYTDAVFWFKLQLINPETVLLKRVLEISYPVLDQIDIYQFTDGENPLHTKMGDKQPFYQRPLLHRNFVLPVKLVPDTTLNIFIRVKTSSSMQIPLKLWKKTPG